MQNLISYLTKRASGLARIIKVGDSFAIELKRFSPDDGSPLENDVQAIDRPALESFRAELAAQMDAIDVVLADCDELNNE